MSSREKRLRQDGSAQAGIYLLRMCQTSLQTPPLAGATLSALTVGPDTPSSPSFGQVFLTFLQPTEPQQTRA